MGSPWIWSTAFTGNWIIPSLFRLPTFELFQPHLPAVTQIFVSIQTINRSHNLFIYFYELALKVFVAAGKGRYLQVNVYHIKWCLEKQSIAMTFSQWKGQAGNLHRPRWMLVSVNGALDIVGCIKWPSKKHNLDLRGVFVYYHKKSDYLTRGRHPGCQNVGS